MAHDPGRATLRTLPAAGRAREMHRRLESRMRRAGLGAHDLERIMAVLEGALAHRLDVLGDEDHFDLLHPSRTMLILLDDCDTSDADVLEAAASIESEYPKLRVAPANAIARDVPTADATDTLLEALVVASDSVRQVAVAERLDHARHLHLGERTRWAPFYDTAVAIWAPVAHRSHPRLARRFDTWCDMFGRRFLRDRTTY